jgi:hypothetical protein
MAIQVARIKQGAVNAIDTARRGAYFVLLLMFPFADQIIELIIDTLPALGRYMPGNVYKWVGFALVAAKVLYQFHRAYRETKDVLRS